MAELTKSERLVIVYQVLVERAQRRETITYEEMASAIQVSNARLVGRYLDPIAVHLLMAGLPALTALVVSKANGKPGEGLIKTPETSRRRGLGSMTTVGTTSFLPRCWGDGRFKTEVCHVSAHSLACTATDPSAVDAMRGVNFNGAAPSVLINRGIRGRLRVGPAHKAQPASLTPHSRL